MLPEYMDILFWYLNELQSDLVFLKDKIKYYYIPFTSINDVIKYNDHHDLNKSNVNNENYHNLIWVNKWALDKDSLDYWNDFFDYYKDYSILVFVLEGLSVINNWYIIFFNINEFKRNQGNYYKFFYADLCNRSFSFESLHFDFIYINRAIRFIWNFLYKFFNFNNNKNFNDDLLKENLKISKLEICTLYEDFVPSNIKIQYAGFVPIELLKFLLFIDKNIFDSNEDKLYHNFIVNLNTITITKYQTLNSLFKYFIYKQPTLDLLKEENNTQIEANKRKDEE